MSLGFLSRDRYGLSEQITVSWTLLLGHLVPINMAGRTRENRDLVRAVDIFCDDLRSIMSSLNFEKTRALMLQIESELVSFMSSDNASSPRFHTFPPVSSASRRLIHITSKRFGIRSTSSGTSWGLNKAVQVEKLPQSRIPLLLYKDFQTNVLCKKEEKKVSDIKLDKKSPLTTPPKFVFPRLLDSLSQAALQGTLSLPSEFNTVTKTSTVSDSMNRVTKNIIRQAQKDRNNPPLLDRNDSTFNKKVKMLDTNGVVKKRARGRGKCSFDPSKWGKKSPDVTNSKVSGEIIKTEDRSLLNAAQTSTASVPLSASCVPDCVSKQKLASNSVGQHERSSRGIGRMGEDGKYGEDFSKVNRERGSDFGANDLPTSSKISVRTLPAAQGNSRNQKIVLGEDNVKGHPDVTSAGSNSHNHNNANDIETEKKKEKEKTKFYTAYETQESPSKLHDKRRKTFVNLWERHSNKEEHGVAMHTSWHLRNSTGVIQFRMRTNIGLRIILHPSSFPNELQRAGAFIFDITAQGQPKQTVKNGESIPLFGSSSEVLCWMIVTDFDSKRNKLDIIFGTGSNLFSHILFEGRAKWLVGGYTKPELMAGKKSTVTSAFKGLKVGFEMGLEEVWPSCSQNVTNAQPICKLDQVFVSSRTLSQPVFDMEHILQV